MFPPISSALIMLGLCAQSLCAQTGARPDTTELTLLGLGFEAEATDVVRVLGRPDSVRAYEHPNDIGAEYERLYYRQVLVFMGPDGLKDGVKLIAPGLTTRRGLAVGDSVDRVLVLYGVPDARVGTELRWRIAARYESQLVVEVRSGRVASIFAGYVVNGLRLLPRKPLAACAPPRAAVPLRATDRLAATASGAVSLTPAPDSPAAFDVSITVHRLPAAASLGGYAGFVAWVATPTLERIRNLGAIENDKPLTARLNFANMLFLVSAERDATGASWTGPIVLAGRCS